MTPPGWSFSCPVWTFSHNGGAYWIGGRRDGHVVIGSPALSLSDAGLRGVIAHELGHAWDVYRTGSTTECHADQVAAAHGHPNPYAYISGC